VLAACGRISVKTVTIRAIPVTRAITMRAYLNTYNVQKQEVLTVSAVTKVRQIPHQRLPLVPRLR